MRRRGLLVLGGAVGAAAIGAALVAGNRAAPVADAGPATQAHETRIIDGSAVAHDAVGRVDVHVRVVDPDTGEALLARVFTAHEARSTDARTGETVLSLVPGRHRIAATRGLEWSIDATDVEVGERPSSAIVLHPRHVAPTPGMVATELRLDRDPTPDALAQLGAAGVALVASPGASARSAPDIVWTRPPTDIVAVATDAEMRAWFGRLGANRAVAAGSAISGYPRTYVRVDPSKAGELGPVDADAVLAAAKQGRSFVTTGPVMSLDAEGSEPGDEMRLDGDHVTMLLRADAAPWIDVSRVEVVAGGVVIHEADVPRRELVTGPEPGELGLAVERAIRFEARLELRIPRSATWMVVVVRGDRSLSEIVPGLDVRPLAFTNPIWLAHVHH